MNSGEYKDTWCALRYNDKYCNNSNNNIDKYSNENNKNNNNSNIIKNKSN